MKTKLVDKKRKILRKIYGALSLSAALFVFQACYGTDRDFGADVPIHGFVKSKTTNQPIAGIKVTVGNQPQYDYTNNSGEFWFYTSLASEYKIRFEDIDSAKNGSFESKDTILKTIDRGAYINVFLNDK